MKITASFEVDGIADTESVAPGSELATTLQHASTAFMDKLNEDRPELVSADQVLVQYTPVFGVPGQFLVTPPES